jgi:hypothetical protein
MNEELENELDDDLRPEYDFARMTGGVRGKYVERDRAGRMSNSKPPALGDAGGELGRGLTPHHLKPIS